MCVLAVRLIYAPVARAGQSGLLSLVRFHWADTDAIVAACDAPPLIYCSVQFEGRDLLYAEHGEDGLVWHLTEHLRRLIRKLQWQRMSKCARVSWFGRKWAILALFFLLFLGKLKAT